MFVGASSTFGSWQPTSARKAKSHKKRENFMTFSERLTTALLL